MSTSLSKAVGVSIGFIVGIAAIAAGVSHLSMRQHITPDTAAARSVVARIITSQDRATRAVESAGGHIVDNMTSYADESDFRGLPVQSTDTYRWAVKGDKVDIDMRSPGSMEVSPAEFHDVYNGKRTFSLVTQPGDPGNDLHFGNVYDGLNRHAFSIWPPTPLFLGYDVDQHGGESIAVLLRTAKRLRLTAAFDPQFGRLDVVDAVFSYHDPVTFAFAPGYGDIAVRITIHNADTDDPGARREAVYEAARVSDMDGVWMTTAGTVTIRRISDGKSKTICVHRVTFPDLHINTVADSAFEPNLPAGTELTVGDDHGRYVVQPNGTWKEVDTHAAAP